MKKRSPQRGGRHDGLAPLGVDIVAYRVDDELAAGVPAGARMPYHGVASNPGTPASAMVGTSGRRTLRCNPVVANILSLPDLT
jgi:hypothetical protein